MHWSTPAALSRCCACSQLRTPWHQSCVNICLHFSSVYEIELRFAIKEGNNVIGLGILGTINEILFSGMHFPWPTLVTNYRKLILQYLNMLYTFRLGYYLLLSVQACFMRRAAIINDVVIAIICWNRQWKCGLGLGNKFSEAMIAKFVLSTFLFSLIYLFHCFFDNLFQCMQSYIWGLRMASS